MKQPSATRNADTRKIVIIAIILNVAILAAAAMGYL